MLSIRIDWAKETFELDVVGHAGYAEHGKGIRDCRNVCK